MCADLPKRKEMIPFEQEFLHRLDSRLQGFLQVGAPNETSVVTPRCRIRTICFLMRLAKEAYEKLVSGIVLEAGIRTKSGLFTTLCKKFFAMFSEHSSLNFSGNSAFRNCEDLYSGRLSNFHLLTLS